MISTKGLEYVGGGSFTIGYVAEIHGPESHSQEVEITRHEVKLLARYYLKDIGGTQAMGALGAYGSDWTRKSAFGERRLGAFVEAGMLSEEELNTLAFEILPSEADLQAITDEQDRRYGVADHAPA